MKTRTHTATLLRLAAAFFILHSAFFLGRAAAQALPQPQIPQPATTGTTPTATGAAAPSVNPKSAIQNPKSDDEVVQLSPFIVSSDKDEGYSAFNTSSGSRLNTELKDTAASIQVFTNEFLDDIGASTLQDVLNYATNVEADFQDDGNFQDNPSSWASVTDYQFRMRGLPAAIMRDYVRTSIPSDRYNVDRIEVASGPNSILYGLGSPGGTILYHSNRANLQRNTLKISNRIGTFNDGSTIPQERLVLNYNVVLIPKTFALRLDTVYQDNPGYRKYSWSNTKRITPAITYRPFKNTTITANYEGGKNNTSRLFGWNAADGITAWLPARPTYSGVGPVPYGLLLQNNNSNHYVFRQEDGIITNDNTTYISTNTRNVDITGGNAIRLPSSLAPYDVNIAGPGASKKQSFRSWHISVDQRAGPVDFQFVYAHNNNDVLLLSPSSTESRGGVLYADPNQLMSPAGPYNINNRIPNPRVNQLYMEDNWYINTYYEANDVLHLTAVTQFDLGKSKWWASRHRVSALVERSRIEQLFIDKNEIWIDDNNVSINTSYSNIGADGSWLGTSNPTPEGDANDVWRRHYFALGDFANYYAGDGRPPVPTFTIGDKTYRAGYVSRTNSDYHNIQYINSYALVAQDYWFRGKLVTTLGARLDEIKFTDQGNSIRVTDPATGTVTLVPARILNLNDPRVLSKQNIFGEAILGDYDTAYYHPRTYTAGIVGHIERFSPLFNYSDNVGAPNLTINILPNGRPGPMPKGTTLEYGLRVDILNNDKLILRLSHYDTRQLGNANITPNGNNGIDSSNLGSDNLLNIYNALVNAGLMTSQEAATRPAYNGATSDTVSQGWEVSLSGNPSKAITFTANFSTTTKERANVGPEIFKFYSQQAPVWDAMANTLTDPLKRDALITTLHNQLIAVYDKMVNNGHWDYYTYANNDKSQITGHDSRSNSLGNRKYKFNFSGRYKFLHGALKGLNLGGGMRFQSGPRIPANSNGSITIFLPDRVYRDDAPTMIGTSLLFFDANASYRFKLLGGRINATVQLNVSNIFNSDTVTQGRQNFYNDGSTELQRVYLNPPRQISLTTTFDF